MSEATVIMGVDPGTNVTGYGIVQKLGTQSVLKVSGVIRLSPGYPQAEKLKTVYEKLEMVVREQSPEVLVVESLFHFKNSQSLIKLSQMRGVILLLGARYGMEIYEYTPMEIKKGLTGYGAATKDQVKFMVAKVLAVEGLKSPDEADALALALYHSHISVYGAAAR